MTKKSNEPQSTVIAFEFAGRTTTTEDGRRVEHVNVTARRGDVGFAAVVEMQGIEADLLPVIRRIQSVFFKAETEGLPEFPNIAQEQAAAAAAQTEVEQTLHINFYGSNDDQGEHEAPEASDSGEEFSGEEASEIEAHSDIDDNDAASELTESQQYYAEIAEQQYGDVEDAESDIEAESTSGQVSFWQ